MINITTCLSCRCWIYLFQNGTSPYEKATKQIDEMKKRRWHRRYNSIIDFTVTTPNASIQNDD